MQIPVPSLEAILKAGVGQTAIPVTSSAEIRPTASNHMSSTYVKKQTQSKDIREAELRTPRNTLKNKQPIKCSKKMEK
eukprot:1275819-Amphidinium_carterae.1